MPAHDPQSERRLDHLLPKVIVSAAFAALAYLLFSFASGSRDVVAALGRVGALGLAAALALSLLNYALRFVRWQLYLRALGTRVPNGPSALIYLSGFAFTTTPGKVGELSRSLFLQGRGMSYRHSFAAFVSERLSDLIAMCVLALPGLQLLPDDVAVVIIGLLAAGALVVVVSWRAGLFALLSSRIHAWQGKPRHIADRVRALAAAAGQCHGRRLFATATILSLAAWGAEGVAFALMLHLLGVPVSGSLAVAIYAVSMLAGAVSFMPGGLGGAEATMIALLVIAGAPHPESIAATVLIRLTTLWFAVGIGVLCSLAGRRALLAPAAAT